LPNPITKTRANKGGNGSSWKFNVVINRKAKLTFWKKKKIGDGSKSLKLDTGPK